MRKYVKKEMNRIVLRVDCMADRMQMNPLLSSMPGALLAEHLQSYKRFIGYTIYMSIVKTSE